MSVDPAQQVVGKDMIIKVEVIEELRRSRLTSHHRTILRKSIRRLNHGAEASSTFQSGTRMFNYEAGD
ncbi:hypothetical protein [Neorhizobium sp. T25_27]|uniref:hypothetical protein n=1 Tax=Neorhizobium sp. T25_27 TaxID=2093831 RepID=UPI00155EF57A|nr:hypothetical protein [Neorhizobium sp. T25_27]